MLSCSKIRTTNKSAHSYYSADDYYSHSTQNSLDRSNIQNSELSNQKTNFEENGVPSFWHGKLAEDFNLSGKVDGKILDNLTQGILPNNVRMRGKLNENQEEVHDAGRDFTFSAPKSLSVLSEVLGVESLSNIHNLAVRNTLDYIQENYAYTRVKTSGKIIKEQTKNLLFGAYTHNTSRELDPQLHTHCVALNVTKRSDGEYRTVLFDPVFDDYKYLGLFYRSNLAFELQKAGFEIEITDNNHGFFEIKGFPKEIIDVFSSRRKQIEEKIKELGIETAKSKEIVTLLTRDKKIDIADHILKEDWNDTLKEVLKKLEVNIEAKDIDNNIHNLDKIFRTSLKRNWQQNLKDNFENIIETKLLPLLRIQNKVPSRPSNNAKESVKTAINILSERNSIFTEKDLVIESMKIGLGKTNYTSITKEISKFKENGFLISGKAIGYSNYLSTLDLLNTELKIINSTKDSLKQENQINSICSKSEFEHLTNNLELYSSLNKGQKQAVKHILTSAEKIIGIQGYAGVGKTHMLKTAAELLKTKNIEIFGLAPTGTAVKEMENVGINSKTLQWFLGKYDSVINGRSTIERRNQIKEELKNKIFILDESSLVSSRQARDLLDIGDELNLKIIFIGDSKQLNAVEAGHPFYQMQKVGLKTVTMDEIVRQKNQKLKIAVEDVIQASEAHNINKGYIKKAFENIDSIVEIKLENSTETKSDLEKIKQKIELIEKISLSAAKEYISLTKHERDNCLILIPSNESRSKINFHIRENLKLSGELGGKTELRTILINKSIEEAQKTNINSYQKGDIIRFNKSYKTNNIIQDIYYQIVDKDLKKGNIHLIDTASKKEIIWSPSKIAGGRRGVAEIYSQETKEFCVGEKINFTRGFLSRGIANSSLAEISGISSKSIKIRFNDQEIELDKKDEILNHIDYGYGFTAHRAQGKTVDNVIAVLESYRPNLTTQKSFYVEISRARHKATLILDDKDKIIKRLEKETGEKISVIDFVEGNKSKSLNVKNKSKSLDKKYKIIQLSESEIKEKFINDTKSKTNINLFGIDIALDKAFSNHGQKVRFGNKNENEVCWYGEAGYIKSYKTGEILKWGIGNIEKDNKTNFKEISDEEFKLHKEDLAQKQNQITLQKNEEKILAAKKAKEYFDSYSLDNLKLADKNQYLIRKAIPEAKNIDGIKFTKDNKIVIPLYNTKDEFKSLHFIDQEGNKKFLKNGEKQGNFFLIAKGIIHKENQVFLAEGFATGASIHLATNKPVAVCFDAGNIEHVLKNLKKSYPEKEFIIAADNDLWKENNIGKQKAELAASKYGAKVILPQFKYEHKYHHPTDFNDLHKLSGIHEVKNQLNNNQLIIHHDPHSKNIEFGL